MNDIECKAFILQKDGSPITCQDRLAMNLVRGRFVVADGVSNSYHPEVTAAELCWLFTQADYAAPDWPKVFHERLFASLCTTWQRVVADHESRLSGRQLRHALSKREDLPPGASTMAGIIVDTGRRLIDFHILGDSTLFLAYDGQTPEWLCTSPATALPDGRIRVAYNNHPSCLVADGRMAGCWASGVRPLRPGFVALATDGLAEWMQAELLSGRDALSRLWALNSHDEFEALAVAERQKMHMHDDLALILLRVNNTDEPITGFSTLCHDELPSAMLSAKPAST